MIWVIGDTGIGEAVTKRLAEGASAVVNTSKSQVDVRNLNDMVETAKAYRPYAAVYCAGYSNIDWLRNQSIGDIREHFDINVIGFMNLLTAMDHLSGDYIRRVIAISSDAARIPMRASIPYCASKAALDMTIKTAAREFAPRMSVMGIRPCYVPDTPMANQIVDQIVAVRGWDKPAVMANMVNTIPMHRFVDKDEVAEVALRMLSIDTPMISGTIVDIAGGR